MRTTGGLVAVIGVLAAACGKQEGGGTPSTQPEGKPADAAAAAAPAIAPAAADAGVAQVPPPVDGSPQRVTATAVDRGHTSAPRGLYEVLVKPGKYTLRSKDGETLTVEVTNVRTVRGARVGQLEWQPEERQGGLPNFAIVTAKGVSLTSWVDDDAEKDDNLASAIAGKPDYADPPRLDRPNGDNFASLIDGMVCLGYMFNLSGTSDEVCGDDTCAWKMCLRPGEIAGADLHWSEYHGPMEYALPAKVPPGKLQGTKLTFSASSTLSTSEVWQFGPAGLGDGTFTTSWQPAKGKGVGEWAEVKLDRPARLDAIEIANGYQLVDVGGLGDLFINNARPRTLTISLDGKPAVIVDLAEKQRGFVRVELGGRTATTLRLTIDAVWPGKKWQDVAINEIVLFGQPAK